MADPNPAIKNQILNGDFDDATLALQADHPTALYETINAAILHAVRSRKVASVTSVAIGTGPKSFTVDNFEEWLEGTPVRAMSAANPDTHWMSGLLTADQTTPGLVVAITIDRVGTGTGTRSDWDLIQLVDDAETRRANGVLTLTANAANTETVVTGGKTYTFQTVLTDVDGNVLIGATASDSLDNLIAAINLGAGSGSTYAASTTANPDVSAAAGAGDTMVATALLAGSAGDLIVTTETLANGSWATATLQGGVTLPIALTEGGHGGITATAGRTNLEVPQIWAIESIESTPPGGPSDGEDYLVGDAPTGDFATHENEMARRQSGAWNFVVVPAGELAVDKATGEIYFQSVASLGGGYLWSGSTWKKAGTGHTIVVTLADADRTLEGWELTRRARRESATHRLARRRTTAVNARRRRRRNCRATRRRHRPLHDQ